MPDRTAASELRDGWKLILACSLGVGCSAIALPYYSIGPLTKPIEATMGWLRSDIQFAILFSSGIGALTAPLTGWMIERFGTRIVAIPALAGVTLGLMFASFSISLGGFWAGFAIAAVLGAGSNPVLWSRVIAGSFDKARGLALGLALSGTALIAILLPNLVAQIEPIHGWRLTLRAIAVLPLILAMPAVYFLLHPRDAVRNDAARTTAAGYTLGEALRGYRFWVLTASILAAYLAISGCAPNLIPAFTDRGIDTKTAAVMSSIYAFSILPGRVLSGTLMDRFWAPLVACGVLLLPALACVIFITASNVYVLSLACVLLGLAAGAELDVLAFMIARYFGLAHFPKIYAISYMALAIGSATAPTIFSRVRETTGGYAMSFSLAAVLFVVGGLLVLMLGRYPDFSPAANDA